MHELHAVLDAWRGLGDAVGDAVLATVVHVSGSAYRRPGARMLILPHGRRVGTVSGGCLEGEIARKAWWYTDSADAVVRVYDTSSGDDAVLEFGLGCNGVVHVMLERLTRAGTGEYLEFLDAHRHLRRPVAVATLIAAAPGASVAPGDRLFVNERGVAGGALARLEAEDIVEDTRRALATRQSFLAHTVCGDVFVEYVAPPVDLVIFGAGDDAQPLTAMAAQLGWCVTVADGRPLYARPDRFPDAARVVVMAKDDLLRDIVITPDTLVVMMTHNYPLDTRLVPLVLERHPRYLGVLGPRHRAERLFDELALAIPDYVHAPVGLDLGGDTPASIALSILSEAQATLSGRAATMLRERDAAIHAPVHEVGDSGNALPLPHERPAYCETMVGSHAA